MVPLSFLHISSVYVVLRSSLLGSAERKELDVAHCYNNFETRWTSIKMEQTAHG